MISWQYNGIAPWSELIKWCSDMFGKGNVNATWDTIYFNTQKEYVLFLLRWS